VFAIVDANDKPNKILEPIADIPVDRLGIET
jgi:hypothetical protein